jgi:5'-nucleotidase
MNRSLHANPDRAKPASPLAMCVAALALAVLVTGCQTAPLVPTPPTAKEVKVRLIAFNDFHGNLRTPSLRVPVADPSQPTGIRLQQAGGVEQLAALVQSLRAGHENALVLSAGDMVGATPLMSALFRDEPTIEAMNLLGVDLHAVGNHEFDYGTKHLVRLREGGCAPDKSGKPDCQGRPPYQGAKFEFLAANVERIEPAAGGPLTLFPPYAIRRFDGVPVGFIGLTLEGTPGIVRPGGTAGLRFKNEVETIRRYVAELRDKGVFAVVVIIHEGGEQTGGINECVDFKGKAKDIAVALPQEVSVVVTGHTHRYYVCELGDRLVTSAGSYGTLVTDINLDVDRATGKVLRRAAKNHVVQPDGPREPRLTALVDRYVALSKPLENRSVAKLSRELASIPLPTGESHLGNLVADAHLAATMSPDRGGAVIAFNNSNSLRAPLIPDADGNISYGALFAAQPFQNDLVVMNLTGAQIKRVLEQQFGATVSMRPRSLNASRGFTFSWDAAKPQGERVIAESIKLNGVRIQPELQYRVAMNSFIAGGGDGYSVFTEGTDRQVSVQDLEALVEYLGMRTAEGPYLPPPLGSRITRLN